MTVNGQLLAYANGALLIFVAVLLIAAGNLLRKLKGLETTMAASLTDLDAAIASATNTTTTLATDITQFAADAQALLTAFQNALATARAGGAPDFSSEVAALGGLTTNLQGLATQVAAGDAQAKSTTP